MTTELVKNLTLGVHLSKANIAAKLLIRVNAHFMKWIKNAQKRNQKLSVLMCLLASIAVGRKIYARMPIVST